MRIGFVGLGKMGGSMARRLSRAGHEVIAYNRTVEVAQTLAEEEERISPMTSLEELVERLPAPRAVWVMIPAGEATEAVIAQLAELLEPGDAIIDGGNASFRDTLRRSEALRESSLHLTGFRHRCLQFDLGFGINRALSVLRSQWTGT